MRIEKSAKELSIEIEGKISDFFGDNATDFQRYNICEEIVRTFSIDFTVYRYFRIKISFERSLFDCSIYTGYKIIDLYSSQKLYDTADFNIFFKEIDEQLRLRIPDKYLEYYNL